MSMERGKLTVLDLFSGIGGFSLGLESSGGFCTKAFCEISPSSREVLKKKWKTKIFEDIRILSVKEILPVDVVCGGFPCQDISIAGKKRGFVSDGGEFTRSGLWYEYARIIHEAKPKYIIIENVRNFINIGLAEVISELNALGYDSQWRIISARELGFPHKRERVWIVAHSRSIGCNVVENIHKERNFFHHINRYAKEKEDEGWPELELRAWKDGNVQRTLSTSFWESKSGILGVVNGLSPGMVRANNERLKQLGNSVIPTIPYLIGKAIFEYENGIEHEH